MILSAQVKTHIETILKSPLHHPVSDINHFPGPGHSTLQYWHCIIQTDHEHSSHHLHFSKFSYFFSESPSFSHLVLVWTTFFLDLCPANCSPRPSSQSESSPRISYQHSASVIFCIFLCKILHDEYVAEPWLILSVKLYAHSTTTSFFTSCTTEAALHCYLHPLLELAPKLYSPRILRNSYIKLPLLTPAIETILDWDSLLVCTGTLINFIDKLLRNW